MKNRIEMLHLNVFLRMAVVGGIAAVVTLLGGLFLADYLDTVFRRTNDGMYRELFYFLSSYRYAILIGIIVVAVILSSRFVFRPIYRDLSSQIAKGFHFSETDEVPIQLPPGLEEVEKELAQFNNEIRLWRYAVKEAEQRKDDLVVYLAHDIRTPLTSVLGYLELLSEEDDLPENQRRKFTQTALRKARRMQSLVEELFEVTRFNISQIETERVTLNPTVLINQLIEELAPILEERGVTAKLVNDGVESVFADPDKIARAIDNVLVNAARYTPAGGEITVALAQTADGRARIRVSNPGADIPQETLNRFFEKFYRGDEARQSGTGGSGLGLAIARQIVRAHGGDITAHSENKETTFTIVI